MPSPTRPRRMPSLAPLLAGATSRDRLVACLGALIAIAATSLVTRHLLGSTAGLPVLISSLGASAVLVFAVPASPLAQPWPVVGGNVVSALVGSLAARLVPQPDLAAGLAVGGAILVMSLLRCLHPPGGGTALAAAIGAYGAGFALAPVGLNAVLFVAAAWAFHRLSGHSYPHRAATPPPGTLHRADIDAALADLGETFDIAPADLEQLLARAEAQADARRRR